MADFDKNFQVSFTADLKPLKKSMKQISEIVEKTLADIEKEMKNLSKTFGKETEEMADSFEDATDEMQKDAKKKTKTVEKEFGKMIKNVTKSFDKWEDEFKDSTDGIVKTSDKATGRVATKFDEMVDNATDRFGELDSDFAKAVSGLEGTAGKVAGNVSSSFNNSIDGMASNSNSIVDRIKNTLGGIGDALRTPFSRISSGFRTATGDMTSNAENLSAGVTGKLRAISGTAKADFKQIEGSFKTGVDEIPSTAQKVSNEASRQFKKVSNDAKKSFNGIPEELRKEFNKMVTESKNATGKMEYILLSDNPFKAFVEAFRFAKTKTKKELDAIVSGVKQELSKIPGFANAEINGGLVGAFRKAFNKIKVNLMALKPAFKSSFTVAGDGVKKVWGNVKIFFSKTFSKIKTYASNTADKMKSEFQNSGNKTESVLSSLKGKLGGIAGAVAGAFGISAISGFIDEVKALNKEIGKVMYSLGSQGFSSEAYVQAFSVLGDEGRAGETVQNLSRVVKSEKDLTKVTELVTDAHLRLGESVTPEALAESIKLTTQKAEVDGNLADVLDDCGITVDDFNDKLGKCKTEQDRLNIITELLAKNYSGATDEFKKMYPELTKLDEATARNQQSMLTLGEKLAPFKTAFLDKFLTPLYDWLGEKIPIVIENLKPLFDKIVGWVTKLVDAFQTEGIQTFLDDMKELGGYIGDAFISVADGVVTTISDLVEEFGKFYDEDGGKGMDTLKDFFSFVKDHGETIGKGLVHVAMGIAAFKVGKGVSNFLDVVGGIAGIPTTPLKTAMLIIAGYEYAQNKGWTDSEAGTRKDVIDKQKPTENSKGEKIEPPKRSWEQSKKEFGEIVDWFKETGGKIGKFFSDLWDDICGFFSDLDKKWGEDPLGDFAKYIWDLFSGIFNDSNTWLGKFVKWCKEFPIKLANALTGGSGTFGKSFSDMFEDAKLKIGIKINSIIGTINEFLGKLGLDNWKLDPINTGSTKGTTKNPNKMMGGIQEHWAKGTDNAPAGRSLVGEAGRELIADPKLGVFMADSPMVVDLSKGATVLKNRTTESLIRNMGIKAYAKGKNEGGFWSNVWDYVTKPATAVKNIMSGISLSGDNLILSALNQWIQNLASGKLLEFVKKVFASDEVKNSPNNPYNNAFGGTGGGFTQAMKWARDALGIAGYKATSKQFQDFMTAFKIVGRYESHYNNASINKWDINAKRGTPSAGWLQFIEPTFKAYARSGYGNWSDGMHQALAFINYANRRYGGALNVPGVKSVLRGGKYKPYANGGIISNPTMALMGEAGQEAVVPLTQQKLRPFGQSVLNAIKEENSNTSGGSGEITINLVTNLDGRVVAQQTAKFTKEELAKLENRSNRLNGRK